MTTYHELMERAQQMMAEAEKLRQEEIRQVIAEIQEKMRRYDLTTSDIESSERKGKRNSKGLSAIKYRGPNGETWAGGRGRKPNWLASALKSGRKLEDFEVH